jgi:hypothetical protein
MAITPEEMQAWKASHAAVSAHAMEVHKRWGGRRPLDPETGAAFDQDHQAVIKEFEQFKEMPEEVWDELFSEEEPDKPKRRKSVDRKVRNTA